MASHRVTAVNPAYKENQEHCVRLAGFRLVLGARHE